MRRYPIEALLRPAVEWQSASVAAAMTGLVIAYPHYLFLEAMPALVLSAGLTTLAAVRGWQGWRIWYYRRHLSRRAPWVLRLQTLKKTTSLCLGRGFGWTGVHVSRLADARSEQGARYLKQADKTDQGGSPVLHGVGRYEFSAEKPVALSTVARSGNVLILGTTGTGKSTALQYWSAQDITRGDVVIVFDPKNDPDVLVAVYQACVKAGRSDQFYLLHLGYPEGSDAYNPVGRYERITEVANRVTGRLSGDGESAVFREFAWVYVNTLARVLTRLGEPVDYATLLVHARDLTKLAERYLAELGGEAYGDRVAHYLSMKRNELAAGLRAGLREYPSEVLAAVRAYRDCIDTIDPAAESLIRLLNVGPGHLDKLIQSLFPFLERLCTGPAAWLLRGDADPARRAFDWESVISQNGVVYVGLDALTDADVAGAVGAAMFADLTALAGKRYNEAAASGRPLDRTVRIYADELSELLGREFIQLVNKGRGAGLSITAFAQSLFDVESVIGNRARARVVLENFNNLLMFRVRNEETTAALTDGLPMVTVQTQMIVSSTQDNPNPDTDIDFTSSTQIRVGQERVPLLSAADIKQLPRGECFADLEGGRIVKLRLPRLQHDTNGLPRSLDAMAEQMRQRYRTSENWAQFQFDFAEAVHG